MVYYKLILNDKRSKSDQIYPIVVRVTSNRISTIVSTGLRVHIKEWDAIKAVIKNSHQNCHILNHQLLDFYSRVQRSILELQDQQDFSFENLKLSLKEQPVQTSIQAKISFNEFAEQIRRELHKSNKSGNALVYQASWNRIPSGKNKLIRVSAASLKMKIVVWFTNAKERNYFIPPKNSA